MDKDRLLRQVKQEMMLAMGCTEPAAAALAGAKARDIASRFGQEIEKIEIYASRDLIKNAMGVGLPSCSLTGIQAAVALGIASGCVSDGLGILSHITPEQVEKAKGASTRLVMVSDVPSLYVRVKVFTKDHTGDATIMNEHDNFADLRADGVLVESSPSAKQGSPCKEAKAVSDDEMGSLSLDEILAIASSVGEEDGQFLLDAVDTNMKIALHGLEHQYGLSVGKVAMKELCVPPRTLSEAFAYAAALAASGSDARMAGCNMGVVINSGSGNQGITVTVPVYVLSEYLKSDRASLVRALFISQTVGLVLTARKDRLSALCGAFTASIATACAYVYLLGGDRSVMDRVLNVMVGDLTGIICDGAKMTCPLKIHSSLSAAGLAVRIAFEGLGPGSESGICGNDSLQAINSLSRISSEGMEETDRTILSIMLEKNC